MQMVLGAVCVAQQSDATKGLLGIVIMVFVALGYALFGWALGSLRSTKRHLDLSLKEIERLNGREHDANS